MIQSDAIEIEEVELDSFKDFLSYLYCATVSVRLLSRNTNRISYPDQTCLIYFIYPRNIRFHR